MGYSIDLNRISVTQYKEHLLSIELLPSRKVLLDNIDSHFSAIATSGINDIGALMQAVSTPKKLADLCSKTHISEDYIKILKREIGSLVPKTVLISEFDMPSEVSEKLASLGLRSSKDFYEAYSSIDSSLLKECDGARLYALCSLVRVNGIGPLAAKIFLEAGFASVADIAEGNPAEMAQRVNDLNNDKQYYGGQHLGDKDMTFCKVHARLLEKYS